MAVYLEIQRREEKGLSLCMCVVSIKQETDWQVFSTLIDLLIVSLSQGKFLRTEWLLPLTLGLLFLNTASLWVYRWMELQENKCSKKKYAIIWIQEELMCASMQNKPSAPKYNFFWES